VCLAKLIPHHSIGRFSVTARPCTYLIVVDFAGLVAEGRAAVLRRLLEAGCGDVEAHITHETVTDPQDWKQRCARALQTNVGSECCTDGCLHDNAWKARMFQCFRYLLLRVGLPRVQVPSSARGGVWAGSRSRPACLLPPRHTRLAHKGERPLPCDWCDHEATSLMRCIFNTGSTYFYFTVSFSFIKCGFSAQGLYFTGASTRPGNGVPLVMIGAQLTAQRICEQLFNVV
jgi:hypothetical protein